jgi:hypothetical protein
MMLWAMLLLPQVFGDQEPGVAVNRRSRGDTVGGVFANVLAICLDDATVTPTSSSEPSVDGQLDIPRWCARPEVPPRAGIPGLVRGSLSVFCVVHAVGLAVGDGDGSAARRGAGNAAHAVTVLSSGASPRSSTMVRPTRSMDSLNLPGTAATEGFEATWAGS